MQPSQSPLLKLPHLLPMSICNHSPIPRLFLLHHTRRNSSDRNTRNIPTPITHSLNPRIILASTSHRVLPLALRLDRSHGTRVTGLGDDGEFLGLGKLVYVPPFWRGFAVGGRGVVGAAGARVVRVFGVLAVLGSGAVLGNGGLGFAAGSVTAVAARS